MLVDLIKNFCESNDEKYSYYENYSGRGMFGRKCSGIVVKQGYSYMQMIIELTKFLDDHDFDDADFELENPAIDDLGLDTIVYFPNMKEGTKWH